MTDNVKIHLIKTSDLHVRGMFMDNIECEYIVCPTCNSTKATLWNNNKNPCDCDIAQNYEYGIGKPAPQPHGHGECLNCNKVWIVPLTNRLTQTAKVAAG